MSEGDIEKGRVTLADVARDCGVSTMTVSNVVRGVQCVLPETREKVERSLKRLGYRAEPMLRALAAYRSQKGKAKPAYRATVAFLEVESNEFISALFDYAREEASYWGYKIESFPLPEAPEQQRQLSRRLWKRGIQGAIISPSRREKLLDGFETEHFTFVAINAFQSDIGCDVVGMDYFQGVTLAMQNCYALGYRRMGLLLSETFDHLTEHRWRGAYYTFCEQWGISRCDMVLSDHSKISWKQVAATLKRGKVEVIFTVTAYDFMEKYLPGVQFVSLNDWMPQSGWWYIKTPRDLMAREAVRQLDYRLCHRLRGTYHDVHHISLKAVWHGP